MESSTPLQFESIRQQKVEIETSKDTALETKLFLKTVDEQGASSLTIGVWKDRKFNLASNAKNADLQQIALQVLKNEVKCSPGDQALLLKALFDEGVSLTGMDQEQRTLLHHAAKSGNLELMQILVDQVKLDINAKDEIGRTPLSYAAESGNKEIVKYLLDHNADVHIASDPQSVPRFDLIGVQPNFDRFLKSKHWEMTPLHYAAISGNKDVVNLLLSAHANVNALNDTQKSPLYLSIEYGHPELIPLLVSPEVLNSPTVSGDTPLILAIKTNQPDVVKSLLEQKADPNVLDSYLESPLHFAVYFSMPVVTKILLENGADVNVKNRFGELPIHYAARINDGNESLPLLIAHGADVNIVENIGLTPLFFAEQAACESNVRTLLASGADPNKVTSQGTALNESARINPEALYSEDTKKITKECTRRKMISLRFGIDGYSKVTKKADLDPELKLEGYLRSRGALMVTQHMRSVTFDAIEKEKIPLENTKSKVTQAFNEVSSKDYWKLSFEEKSKILDNYLKQLDSGQLIVVPTGWTGHAVYMLFLKTGKGILCVECNRGERARSQEGGFTVFTMKDPKQLNRDSLDRLLIAQDRTFTGYIFLSFLSQVEQIGMKDQKSGSCSFTSAKTAFFASLYITLQQEGLNELNALDLTKKYYRSWTQIDRAAAINEMLDEYEKGASPIYQQDHHLLFSALSKMKSTPPIHPEYAKARERLMNFLEKNAPTPWVFNREVDQTHFSPLSYAIRNKQKDLIQLMVKKGVDINAVDPGNWTPLQRAISEGDKDMVSFLLKQGAKLKGMPGQEPPIHVALNCNRMDMVSHLLKKMKKEGIDLNIPNNEGVPLIHRAAFTSRSAVEFLVSQGVALDVRDQYGQTTLQKAIMTGNKEVVKYLIEQGASLNDDPQNGIGPLQLAIYYGHVDLAKEIAQQMRQKELSITSKDACHHQNITEMAASKFNEQFFNEISEFGITLNEQEKVICCNKAILASADPANFDTQKALSFLNYFIYKQAVNLNATDAEGYRPIDYALSTNAPEFIVTTLIDKMADSGTDLYDPGQSGESIYAYAAANGRTDMTQYMDAFYPKTQEDVDFSI